MQTSDVSDGRLLTATTFTGKTLSILNDLISRAKEILMTRVLVPATNSPDSQGRRKRLQLEVLTATTFMGQTLSILAISFPGQGKFL